MVSVVYVMLYHPWSHDHDNFSLLYSQTAISKHSLLNNLTAIGLIIIVITLCIIVQSIDPVQS